MDFLEIASLGLAPFTAPVANGVLPVGWDDGLLVDEDVFPDPPIAGEAGVSASIVEAVDFGPLDVGAGVLEDTVCAEAVFGDAVF